MSVVNVLHVTRLIRILNVAARYRLQDFLKGRPGTIWVQLALAPFSPLHVFGAHQQLNKNERLRLALVELGPIYIKFGQLLSTRRDFLDAELASELEELHDNVPPFLTPSIKSLVEEALGTQVEAVFEYLDPQPLASASMAQVHKATLLGGDEVVVKVLRPGIEQVVRADMGLLKSLAKLIQINRSLRRRLRPVEVIQDYEKVILGELNLLAEAANTSQLRQNSENIPQLYVPKVYWDWTRTNLLVLERIHGAPVSDIPALQASNINLKQLAENGVNIFFTQVFEHNFFHADMHPGNIFVATDEPEAARFIAIDCAIIGSLTRDDQQYLAKNLLAIFRRNYRRVAELHVDCGWVPESTSVHEFESAIRTVCEPFFEKPLKDISFAQILVELFR
ncbi:MAG: AarF/UbiB family protein, partial [Gammaproteobacteria bacterium]|nr:AarF/UbiB family protein [Gammaproteobacteria bacterium]